MLKRVYSKFKRKNISSFVAVIGKKYFRGEQGNFDTHIFIS